MSDRSLDSLDVTQPGDGSHEYWLEAAAAYALDSLDTGERDSFESHLVGCAVCRGAVQEYREVTGLLMHATPAVAAPSNLAARVGRMVAEERGTSAAHVAAAGTATGTTPPATDGSDSDVVSLEDRRARQSGATRGRWRPSTVWLAAAGVAFAAVSGVLWQELRKERALVTAAAEAFDRERSARESLLENLRGTRVHVVSLASPGGGAPVARVFWNHDRNNYVVTAFGLPPAPQGRTYQLWAIAKGRGPVSMGTFNTDANGVAMVIIPVTDVINDLGVIDVCALTQEPAGGSPGPTETPRLAGEWRHTD